MGPILAAWIAAEIGLLPPDARHWIEPAYVALATAMVALGATPVLTRAHGVTVEP